MKSKHSMFSLINGRAILAFVLCSSLFTTFGCMSMMSKPKKKESLSKEFSCGEPLPGRAGRIQTEYQMPH